MHKTRRHFSSQVRAPNIARFPQKEKSRPIWREVTLEFLAAQGDSRRHQYHLRVRRSDSAVSAGKRVPPGRDFVPVVAGDSYNVKIKDHVLHFVRGEAILLRGIERPVAVPLLAAPLLVSPANPAARAKGREQLAAVCGRDGGGCARELHGAFVRATEKKIHSSELPADNERDCAAHVLRVNRRIVTLSAERGARKAQRGAG